MRIILNAGGNLSGGPLQTALATIKACNSIIDNEYHVFLGPNVRSQLDLTLFGDNFKFYIIPKLLFFRFQRYFSSLEIKIVPDVVFSIYGPSYWRPKSPHVQLYAHGYYIYPESPYIKNLSIFQKIPFYIKRYFHLMYYRRDVDTFICQTTDVMDRAKVLIGLHKHWFVVSNTCSDLYYNPILYDIPILSQFYNKKFILLTVAKYYPHKNLSIIKPVITELLKLGYKDFLFVLTIEYDIYIKLFSKYERNFVVTVGPTNVTKTPSLYYYCNAMFLPSLVECFSASYPESMAMSKPIITSDLGFAHSICSNAAIYFNPCNPIDIANCIYKISHNSQMQKTLIQNGKIILKKFPNSDERANLYLNICKKTILYLAK